MESLPTLHHFSWPASFKAAYVNLWNKQVIITDHVRLPYPSPGNIIQRSPWADWTLSNKTKSNTDCGGEDGMLTCPREDGARSRSLSTKLSINEHRKRNKGWERRWGDKPTSQSGAGGRSQSCSRGTEGSIQNWISPPCLGGVDQTELQLKGNTVAAWWKQQ
jgi:hypothetical protein